VKTGAANINPNPVLLAVVEDEVDDVDLLEMDEFVEELLEVEDAVVEDAVVEDPVPVDLEEVEDAVVEDTVVEVEVEEVVAVVLGEVVEEVLGEELELIQLAAGALL